LPKLFLFAGITKNLKNRFFAISGHQMELVKMKVVFKVVSRTKSLSPKAGIFKNFLSWSKRQKKKVDILHRGHGQA
jgi:hypothetical protein